MLLKVIFAIATIVFLGHAVAATLFRDSNKYPFFERAVISFGLGCGVAGAELFFLSVIGIKLSAFSIIVFQIPLYIWGIRLCSRDKQLFAVSLRNPRLTIVELFFAVLTCFNFLSILLISCSQPLWIWDSWSVWGHKAKLIFLSGGMPAQLLTPAERGGAHLPHYPLLFPFLEAYIWFFLGAIKEECAKVWGPLFYLGTLLCFYSTLKITCRRSIALGFTFLLSMIEFARHATSGYAEILLVFYFTGAVLYSWRYVRQKDPASLLLACFFMGIAMWLKNEGIAMCCAIIGSLVFCIITKQLQMRRKSLLIYSALPFVIFLPWVIYRISHGLGVVNYYKFLETHAALKNFIWEKGRLPFVLHYFATEMCNVEKWGLLWFFLGMTVLLPARVENRFLLGVIILQLFFFIGVLFSLPIRLGELPNEYPAVVSRLFFSLVPLTLFFVSPNQR